MSLPFSSWNRVLYMYCAVVSNFLLRTEARGVNARGLLREAEVVDEQSVGDKDRDGKKTEQTDGDVKELTFSACAASARCSRTPSRSRTPRCTCACSPGRHCARPGSTSTRSCSRSHPSCCAAARHCRESPFLFPLTSFHDAARPRRSPAIILSTLVGVAVAVAVLPRSPRTRVRTSALGVLANGRKRAANGACKHSTYVAARADHPARARGGGGPTDSPKKLTLAATLRCKNFQAFFFPPYI